MTVQQIERLLCLRGSALKLTIVEEQPKPCIDSITEHDFQRSDDRNVSKELFDYRFDLLTKEMDHLQEAIREHDKILFAIRGWALTIFSTVALFAIKDEKSSLIPVAGMSVCLFWVMDAIFKSFQDRFTKRYRKLETVVRTELPVAMKSGAFSIASPQMVNPATLTKKQFILLAIRSGGKLQLVTIYGIMLLSLVLIGTLITE